MKTGIINIDQKFNVGFLGAITYQGVLIINICKYKNENNK